MNRPKSKTGARKMSEKGNNKAGLKSKDKLLQSAKTLFAEKGLHGVSVREITARANVNSALVAYYFGGKLALFDEVYRSYAEPLAMDRLKRLKALTENENPPSVEDIMKAWLLPWLQARDDPQKNALHVRFTANVSTERWKHRKKAARYTQRTNTAFIEALHRCLPHLSRDTLTWRLHFIVGAIAFGIRDPDPLLAFSKGRCDPTNAEKTLVQILPFAINGLCSPEPE